MNPTASDATVPRFVRAVYDMLQNEDQRILSWSADGSHFQVYDVPRLETKVLRKYFKHGKFTSFQRQLNNFGFHKWTKTRASVATFSHDVLVRCHVSELAVLQQRRRDPRPCLPSGPGAFWLRRETSSAAKKQKMSPRDVCAVDDLAEISFDCVLEPLWALGDNCNTDDGLLLDPLDSVELTALVELDWDAAISPLQLELEADARADENNNSIDVNCAASGLLSEDDVAAVVCDLDAAQVLSNCELDSLLGDASDSDDADFAIDANFDMATSIGIDVALDADSLLFV
ncbi:hypothetical protein PHYSODRAFT_258136 [Phytophthora sojae]|uniref:HSF-type DNA-binding domain-containing protein n=1 Tax=Phytophthora sojae (strain P6497) TaxID=1094619 RepID=G5AF89_PHYSP|nr:hypothetical protein PHYSODRAFT_258136 [Phytophthora sojae]EGZ05879.1 hypothetical protein PHYSODRAFT_258136 [Phytophthora sojae]|eukprot:XP_009538740.1 hypothetical protein PHYSODRAFT_258136 [Phytophthora sojae]